MKMMPIEVAVFPKVLRKVIVHLRDNKWSDLRRRYTRNRDRLSKTGEGGGAAAHLDEQDLLVERIVTGPNGEGRAAVSGLDVLSDGCSANGDAVDPSVANGTCKSSPSNAVIVEDDAKDESDKADGPERPSPPNLSVDCDKGILKETRKKRGKRVTAGNADANDDLKAARIEYIKQKTRFYELSCAKLLADLGHHQRIDESTEGRG